MVVLLGQCTGLCAITGAGGSSHKGGRDGRDVWMMDICLYQQVCLVYMHDVCSSS